MEITVTLTKHELAIINNALNELCQLFAANPDGEYEIRTGSNEDEVSELLEKIHKVYEEN
jgi:hypothetical protein